MEILLEEFYNTDLQLGKFYNRMFFIDSYSYELTGVSKSGKTALVKNYLLGLKKNSYLYIDCNDIRIDTNTLNKELKKFCIKNKIDIVALDNYNKNIDIPNVSQLIITSEISHNIPHLNKVQLYPLSYEEFLAHEQRFDSTALNHFIQLGGFAIMHNINADERNIFIQQLLRCKLSEIEFEILTLCAKFNSQKLSAFNIYERLKQHMKISKDKLYKSFELLVEKKYIHLLSKFNYPKAIKKVYLCDTSLKPALSVEKNFARLFENIIFLELIKNKKVVFYDDGVSFYIPKENEIILCKPFAEERRVFQKLEQIEAFLFTHSISKVTVITISKETKLSHPLCEVEIIPFNIWAVAD